MKLVPRGPIDNKSALVQVMAWHRSNRRQAITRTNADLVHQRILAALEGEGLTHWGRMTHICVSKLTIIGSDNGLSPERRQFNIWTNAGILLIGTLGTSFSEILGEINTFSFKKMHLKTSSAKRWPFCLGLNVLICHPFVKGICRRRTSERIWTNCWTTILVAGDLRHYYAQGKSMWYCRCLRSRGKRLSKWGSL